MESVDCREFTEWQAYDELDPIGPQPVRQLLAQLLAIYLNVHLSKDAPAARPSDFMPWVEPPEPTPMSPAEMQRSLQRAMGTPE